MRILTGCVVMVTLLVTGCGAPEPPPGPPLDLRHNTRDLMAGMIDASADALWDAVGTILDDEGETYWEPETEEDWLAVTGAAMTLMESGNLLMLGPRKRDDENWVQFSQAMIDASAIALDAAQRRDPQAVFDSGEIVYNSCNNCHNLYWVGDEQRGRTIR
ncbi:MAG: hypothetical protein F4Y45_08690 [Acidobacteria bacterium]|nr:hypothetical protein [Acidobacteriota bacterium]MXZ72708.1 hypothetical protein [Acidobacteriota bacterium]MYD69821.1 hypothetical protein [Acidobacteriota bacterium]MYJ03697.1 hypothetical protein [Acidobacteriota bacterium]